MFQNTTDLVELPKFKCDHLNCGKTFSARRYFDKHIKRFNHLPILKCSICSIKCEDESLLKTHKLEAHSSHQPSTCQVDQVEIIKIKNQIEILNENTNNTKPFKCSEEGCKSSYARRQGLVRHIDQIHNSPVKPFKCDVPGCFASFDFRTSLAQHRRNKRHQKQIPKKYKCAHPGCSENFEKEWQLKEHSFIHTNDNPFKCVSCPMEFNVFESYKIHSFLHQDIPKNHICSKCIQFPAFDTLEEYENHMRERHGKSEYKCEECGKSFKHSGNLKIHKKTHKEERDVYECPYEGCERSYFYKRNVTSHIEIEHEMKKHDCSECEKKFSTKQRLDLHIKTMHCENKPIPRKKKTRTGIRREKLLVKLANGRGNSAEVLKIKKVKSEKNENLAKYNEKDK